LKVVSTPTLLYGQRLANDRLNDEALRKSNLNLHMFANKGICRVRWL